MLTADLSPDGRWAATAGRDGVVKLWDLATRAEVATLLTGPAWSGHRVIELGSMVSADEVAAQLGDVMQREVKAFAVPRAEWPAAFEQFGIPKGQTGPAEAMFEAVNAGWMDLGVAGTEHVASTTLPRDVFAAVQKSATA